MSSASRPLTITERHSLVAAARPDLVGVARVTSPSPKPRRGRRELGRVRTAEQERRAEPAGADRRHERRLDVAAAGRLDHLAAALLVARASWS